MLKYIKFYRFRSIFLKNMCIVFLLLLLPFLLTFYLLKNAYDRVWETEQNKYKEAIVAHIENNINDIMDELYSKMLLLQSDKNVKLFAYAEKGKTDNTLYVREDISETLRVMSGTSDYLKNIYLYAPNSEAVMTKEGYSIWNKEDFKWIHTDLKFGIYHESRTDVSSPKMYIYNVLNSKRANQLTIIYEIDTVVFKKKVCGENNNYIELLLNGEKVWASKELTPDEKKELVYVEKKATSEDLAIKVYFEKNVNPAVFQGLVQIQKLSIGGLSVMMLLTIWLLSARMYYPVRTIMEALENFERSKWIVGNGSEVIENKNELECILNVFYQEYDKNHRAESELSERIVMMKRAQMVALQAQINPHFIFNTLDAINWMALKKLGKRNEVSLMTTELAKMIRLSTENANTLIPLDEEIKYALIFVRIMQMRCDKKFQVHWNIPDSLLQYDVVKLTLQPLIENAINHGALKLAKPSVINISAYAQKGMLYICVADSGPGMKENDLETLRNRMEKETLQEDKHFGLSNVNRRLHIMFGEKSGVSIESKIDCGTKVTIMIPIEI